MNDSKMTNSLTQTWVAVTDALGRTHLEARWSEPSSHDAPVHAPHAA